jgi:hypothetical protein
MSYQGTLQVFVGLRDRAMLLLASQTAFRGESARILLWSDLFQTMVPMDDISLGTKAPVCRPFPICVQSHRPWHSRPLQH